MPRRSEGPTIHDMARVACVSTATITRVLRNDPHVAPETRARVLAVLDGAGYQVNAAAQSLRTRRTTTVAHILQGLLPNTYFSNVARGLQQEAFRRGFEVLTYSAEGSARTEREAVASALRHRVGAIIFTTPLNSANVAMATGAGVTVVQVERPTEMPSRVVTVDNYHGALDATCHLISLGHRDICFLSQSPPGASPQGPSVEAARLRGYLDAVGEAGLRPRVRFGPYASAQVKDFQAPGREHMLDLLSEKHPPTALFAGSDMLAAGALQTLYAKRRRVPDDLAIVGFDDTYASALSPALTTVAVPMCELGETALRSAVVEGYPDQVELPTQLVVRDSTGSANGPPATATRPPDQTAPQSPTSEARPPGQTYSGLRGGST